MRIYGDYHMHTKFTHGKNTIFEMAQKAKEMGLNEIAITEHGYGHWLHAIKRRYVDIMKAEAAEAARQTGVKIYIGIETNILSTAGDIDLTKKDYGDFDLVLGGIHRAVKKGKGKRLHFWLWQKRIEENTEIVLRTIKNNKLDILVHPGRYLPVDLVKVADACREAGVLFELNSNSCRYTHEEFVKLAATGAKFIVNSDAHCKKRVGDVNALLMRCGNIFADGQIVNTNKDFRWKP